MKGFTKMKNVDLSAIEHRIKSSVLSSTIIANSLFISTKNFDEIYGLDKVLSFNISNSKKLYFTVNTYNDANKIDNLISKLSQAPTADIYLKLMLIGYDKSKSLGIATKLFKSLQIKSLKL
mmetsp:Transcript_7947/g.7032  ORF Transcript_7947/g.7032 Transcript_7947/m.7032 type:complete len:121 (+) Transcript_7947:887-1249(+)